MSNESFRITRKIEIDAAHRVPDHRSKCFAVHGHRYVIEASCSGSLVTEGEQRGMVMDFGFLKECMMTAVHDTCDHGIILWDRDPILNELAIGEHWWKIRKIDCVPTAENLARVWHGDIEKAISKFFKDRSDDLPNLKRVRVYETPNCWADWPQSVAMGRL